jgi:restriction system protein
LLDKYGQYISTFLPIAHGKIYQDEYGDEIWEGADREINKIVDDKVFKRENIRDRDEFYSFESLSRCEPAFGSEYSDCWIFDELKDRLKVYHQTRLHTLAAAGDMDPDKMSGTEFEQWLIASIRQAGIVDAKPTKRTGDQGADIIVRQGRTIVIQAKCYQQSVGNAAVQEVHAARIHYAADEAWVVTNSTFTRSARELATSTGVRLVDRSSFRDIGSLITQAIASEDQQLRAEPRPSECAVPGDLRSASECSNPARETESAPEPTLPLIASDCATPPPSDAPVPSPADDPPQTAARIVAAKSRRVVSGSIAVIVLVGTAAYLLMSHYSRERAEQRVREVLAVWTSTILSNDLAGQVDCYAPTVAPFFQRASATLQEVATEKERVMKTYPLVRKYVSSNISFERVDANRVVVSFDKTWEARGRRTFAGSERQSLELRPLGGRWRIIGERELQIYWVRTK